VLQTAPRFSGKLFEHPTTPDFSSTIGTNVEAITSNGDHVLFATCPITYPKWVLVLREDPQEEMAPLFKAQYAEALILISGIFLVVLGTVLTTRSMTSELIRMEHQKAESDDLMIQSAKMAALGKMAAGIAHEINNPLAIIGEKAGWMKDLLEKEDIKASPNLGEFEDCIKKIERQVDRSRTITHRLLRFGRRMEPTEEMVDVNQILAETITFLENEAHYRDIRIQTAYADKLPRVTTDSAQLQQVFLNIINNAIDAVGKGGSINLRTSYDGGNHGNVVIEISDNARESQRLWAKSSIIFPKSPRTQVGLSISSASLGSWEGISPWPVKRERVPLLRFMCLQEASQHDSMRVIRRREKRRGG
jgi:two-component system NtrC family sensor kinase